MIRILGWTVFAAGFLLISPSFRGSVMQGIDAGMKCIESYSPYSYVLLIGLALFAVSRTLMTGQPAR